MNTRRPARSLPNRPAAVQPAGGLERLPLERLEIVAALLLTLWIVVLHLLWLFDAGPLWRDEVGTIDFASMPTWADIWNNLQYDNFPPLFVAIARVWMAAGFSSDFGCRILGFLAGVAGLGMFWWDARAFGVRAPLLALALYALNPLAIRVGDSLRPYGLGIALTVLSLALIWKFAQNPEPKRLFSATLVAVLAVQCLYQSAFFLIAFSCGAWAATPKQWKRAAQTAMIGAAAALSLLPYWVNIKKGRDWFGISLINVSFDAIWQLLASSLHRPGGWMVVAWVVLLLVAAAIALIGGIGRRTPMLAYLGSAMVAAAALYVVFVRFLGLQPRPWYFLILMATEAVGIDAVFGQIKDAQVRLGRIVLTLVLALSCVPLCYAGVRMRQSNIDLIAAKLKAAANRQDLILISPWYYGVSLQRYLDTNRWTTLPPIQELRIHRYDLMKKQMEAENPITPLLDGIERTLRSGHSLWVVGVFQFPPPGQPQPILPPYRPGSMDMPDARYFSSWMFQLSQLVQAHATQAEQVPIPTPGNLPVNPLEEVPVLRFSGWR